MHHHLAAHIGMAGQRHPAPTQAVHHGTSFLLGRQLSFIYPIRDGIPIMPPEEARHIDET